MSTNNNLVGKLHVELGDLIRLIDKGRTFEAGGFVVGVDGYKVALSFENPYNNKKKAWFHRIRQISNPVRKYDLRTFTGYTVSRKHANNSKE